METDTLNDRVAANIRAELARRKITQEQFAESIGMGRTAFTALVAGRTAINLRKLERIATVLKVEPSKLLSD